MTSPAADEPIRLPVTVLEFTDAYTRAGLGYAVMRDGWAIARCATKEQACNIADALNATEQHDKLVDGLSMMLTLFDAYATRGFHAKIVFTRQVDAETYDQARAVLAAEKGETP